MLDTVWLIEEACFATVINRGAFYSYVEYCENGVDYEVYVSNDEFIEADENFDEMSEDV